MLELNGTKPEYRMYILCYIDPKKIFVLIKLQLQSDCFCEELSFCVKMKSLNLLRICNFCRKFHTNSILHSATNLNKPESISKLLKKHQCLNKKPRGKNSVYLLNKDVSDEVAKVINNEQTNKASVILELNSGPGVLSSSLVDCSSGNVICTEQLDEFQPYLQELKSRYPGRVTVSQWEPIGSLFKTSPLSVVNKYFDRESEVMSQIPNQDWTNAPPLTVVGSVLPHRWYLYLSYLIKHLAMRDGLYSAGRVEWFLFIPSRGFRWYWNAAQSRSIGSFYSTQGIMLTLLFNMKHHLTLPASTFTPHFPGEKSLSEKSVRTIKVKKDDAHLLQLTPKADCCLTGDDVIKFQLFLQQLLSRGKNQRLIPRMEQWIPGIGIPLINLGCTMMQKMGDIDPDQLLEIYKVGLIGGSCIFD
ncbi:hypothetical protein ScPMuIL_013973 [Solemya velum]